MDWWKYTKGHTLFVSRNLTSVISSEVSKLICPHLHVALFFVYQMNSLAVALLIVKAATALSVAADRKLASQSPDSWAALSILISLRQ